MPSEEHTAATYRTVCPKCGAALLGFTKQDYIDHLRENGETLAARIEAEMVVCGEDTKQR
jgi:transcription initiation factor IIE alpha subunit